MGFRFSLKSSMLPSESESFVPFLPPMPPFSFFSDFAFLLAEDEDEEDDEELDDERDTERDWFSKLSAIFLVY